MSPLIAISAIVLAVIIFYALVDFHSRQLQKLTHEFMKAHGLTNDTYNGAGCASQTLARAYKKTGDSDPANWVILAGPLDFQLAVYGRYPRNLAGVPTFCGVEILFEPTQGFPGLGNFGRALRPGDPRVATARLATAQYFEDAAASEAKRTAERQAAEDKALALLERALRNVATEPSTAGALLAAALGS